jgi:hypothetical protein
LNAGQGTCCHDRSFVILLRPSRRMFE